jgi:CUE domain
MSISYEEALATLQAMFGDPWTRETLDAVLRHEKGHMENTCELILQHGDKDPQILVDRLKSGGPEPQVAMDEQLARQLAAQSSGRGGGHASASAPGNKSRGTPTVLPDDFLRLPGCKPSVSAGASAGAMDDETLARMLQDELFSEELARNPDFAHLARGGRRNTRTSASNARIPAGRRPAAGAPPQNPFEGVNLMQKVSGKSSLEVAGPYVLAAFQLPLTVIVRTPSFFFLFHSVFLQRLKKIWERALVADSSSLL